MLVQHYRLPWNMNISLSLGELWSRYAMNCVAIAVFSTVLVLLKRIAISLTQLVKRPTSIALFDKLLGKLIYTAVWIFETLYIQFDLLFSGIPHGLKTTGDGTKDTV